MRESRVLRDAEEMHDWRNGFGLGFDRASITIPPSKMAFMDFDLLSE